MSQTHQPIGTNEAPPFRLDVQLHDLLMKAPATKPLLAPPPTGEPQALPTPTYPSRPELQKGADADYFPTNGRRRWTVPQIMHAMNGWALPYVKSRLLPGTFHP